MSSAGSAQPKPATLANNIETKLPGFGVTAQDLKTPTSQLVVSYYTSVMEELSVDFGQSYNVKDPALAIKLYYIVQHVFLKLGITFFSFDDIVNPVSKRILQLFAIMDNFHSFADQQAQEVLALKNKRAERLAAVCKLTRAKDDLREQENQQAVRRATRLDQTCQLQNHMEELKVARIAVGEKKYQLCEQSKIIREKKLESAKNSVDKLADTVRKMDEELAQLDRKIVTKTPEELCQELEALEEAMHMLECDLKVQNAGWLQKVERVVSLEAELGALRESNLGVVQTCTELSKEREFCSNSLVILRETESVEATWKLMHQELQAVEKDIAKLEKVHDVAKRDSCKKVTQLEDDFSRLKQEFANLRKSQDDLDVEMGSFNDQISALAPQKEEEIRLIKTEHKAYEEAYERYTLMVKSYAEEVLKGLKNCVENI